MDFDLSDEQKLVADNVARLMKDKYGFESRKAYGAAPLGFSEELWRQYAELGLLGAPFAEEDGGYGGGAVEIMLTRRRSAARWRWSPISRPSCWRAARCATARPRPSAPS